MGQAAHCSAQRICEQHDLFVRSQARTLSALSQYGHQLVLFAVLGFWTFDPPQLYYPELRLSARLFGIANSLNGRLHHSQGQRQAGSKLHRTIKSYNHVAYER